MDCLTQIMKDTFCQDRKDCPIRALGGEDLCLPDVVSVRPEAYPSHVSVTTTPVAPTIDPGGVPSEVHPPGRQTDGAVYPGVQLPLQQQQHDVEPSRGEVIESPVLYDSPHWHFLPGNRTSTSAVTVSYIL